MGRRGIPSARAFVSELGVRLSALEVLTPAILDPELLDDAELLTNISGHQAPSGTGRAAGGMLRTARRGMGPEEEI